MPFFKLARPVWLIEAAEEMNVHLLFRAEISTDGTSVLRITAADVYRAWLNDTLIGYGPARAAHGYARTDAWPLPEGGGMLYIEVACYRVNNFCYPLQNGFLQAEVYHDETVLVATGHAEDFVCARDTRWIQRVQRYSYQRTFIESTFSQRRPIDFTLPAYVAGARLQERRVDYPRFSHRYPVEILQIGTVATVLPKVPSFRQIDKISNCFLGYLPTQLAHRPDVELLSLSPVSVSCSVTPWKLPLVLRKSSDILLRLDGEKTGFFHFAGFCETPAMLYLSFDEILSEGTVDFLRLQCSNVITLSLVQGAFSFETIEPYSAQYLRLTLVGGDITLQSFFLREYASPQVDDTRFICEDNRLNDVFSAALETYRQNAVDLFTDCPSRERAGWLCDSFFLARSEALLAGSNRVEHNFLENYALGTFSFLPKGMLPMCYPADHNSGEFIPNWALWFILELDEAATLRGLKPLAMQCLPMIKRLFAYFERFALPNGLLAKLENWVFIEWSRTSEFMQDINFPTNMLYAAALETAGKLYQNKLWQEKGRQLKQTIRTLSFNGTFFVDNALLVDDTIVVTKNTTECCQYYALYFNLIGCADNPEFFERIRTQFGPLRQEARVYPTVYRANAFIGNYLRLEILRRAGFYDTVLEECVAFFAKMAHATKTLWENDTPVASCNHGFAAYAANLILYAAGVERISPAEKTIVLRSRSPISTFDCVLPLDENTTLQLTCRAHQVTAKANSEWHICIAHAHGG